MNSVQMRDYVSKAYPGVAWKNKVSRMSDNQVLAVYTRLLHSGKLK